MLGLTAGGPALDVESLPPLVVDDRPELREPADPAAPPVRAAVPVVFNGRIDPAGDEDRFVLAVTPGQKLRIEVEAAELGSALDGVLQVLGAKGAVLATADDTTSRRRPGKEQEGRRRSSRPTRRSTSPCPAGMTEITLALRDLEGRGGRRLPVPDHRRRRSPRASSWRSNDAQVSIPRGARRRSA